jgi:hypothetical protein
MLKHYLEKLSSLEFDERDAKIPVLVTKEKGAMNARGVLVSTMTLKAVANFFTEEFLLRCDFLQNFIVSHPNLLNLDSEGDTVTTAKSLFQTFSFAERDKLKILYLSSISTIACSLQNVAMKSEIEQSFVAAMEKRILKNNLYLEIELKEAIAAKPKRKSVLMLQPNINGIGIDLSELWRRHFRKTK